MLVVDECHRAASPANSRALVPCAASLGLSATPERQYDDGFERHLVPALGPLIYEYNYRAALADGVVAPFELHNFEFKLSSGEEAEYNRLSRRIAQRASRLRDEDTPGITEIAPERLLFARARIVQSAKLRVPSAVALVERFRGRALVFHERIEGAEAISRLLDLRGHRVATYHSRLSVSFRQRNLRLFKRGEIDVLVTCRALDEGLNVPDAETAIIASSTKSTRQRIQRLGRVLRATPGKLARVATLSATASEKALLKKEAANLEDVAAVRWYSIERRVEQ
jgi:superfamily II DNA or RNA helicase